ncbi:Arc family DNA-binding protein [Stutzerimonas stutzeri]
MPAALRAQVERSAWAARRSLNAEIVIRLEASFAQVAPSTNAQERSASAPSTESQGRG